MAMFDSLDEFRAHCGELAMPREQCPTCVALPDRFDRQHVSSMVSDYDVDYGDEKGWTNVPAEAEQLEVLIAEDRDHGYDPFEGGIRKESALLCATCRRLYLVTDTLEFIGARNYHRWIYERIDRDALFRTRLAVAQRLQRSVDAVHPFFPHHAIAKLDDDWFSIDDTNQRVRLTTATLAALIASDPPQVSLDYALFVDGIDNPGARRRASFESIVWRQPMWDFEQREVDSARAASRVEPPVLEREGELVRVRFWVTHESRLIRRVIIVQPDGRYQREDTVTGSMLPVAWTTPPHFKSREAFRAFCGPTRIPIEQCPLCSTLPALQQEDNSEPRGHHELVEFIGDAVRRCPTCAALYFCSSFSGGNDIYRGNETTYTMERKTVDQLFDSEWGVSVRVPERRAALICSDRLFSRHLLVRFGSTWTALDDLNQLMELDRPEAITRLIERDPPVLADLELAARYAVFIDNLEHPGDERLEYFEFITMRLGLTLEEKQQLEDVKAAMGLLRKTEQGYTDLRPTAERDGDRIIVRSWVVSNKRLICRIHTVQPSGRVGIEDAVIAENLPR